MPQDPAPVVVVLGRGRVDADEPVLAVDDLGFTRGDGCFDSLSVVTDADGRARAIGLPAHLDRLAASAAALRLSGPSRAEWEGLAREALDAWHTPGEATLALFLSRGREWTPPDERPCTAFVVLRPRGDPATDDAAFAARRGLRVVTLSRGHPSDAFRDAPWLLGGVKTLAYAVNVAARQEARDRGADDALFVSTDGFVLDGPTSAFLAVVDGELRTTPTGETGVLESTSVSRILRAAREDGMPARAALVPVADLPRCDGAWLVASSRGPAPITRLDGAPLRVDPDLVARIARYAGL